MEVVIAIWLGCAVLCIIVARTKALQGGQPSVRKAGFPTWPIDPVTVPVIAQVVRQRLRRWPPLVLPARTRRRKPEG